MTIDTAPLAIPERTHLHGPLTRRRLRRTTAGFVVAWAIAGALIVAGGPAARAFGVGLLFPGAGFVYTSDLPLLLLTLATLPYVAFHFQMRADNVAPAVVWLGAAAGAALRVHTGLWSWALWAMPLALATGILVIRVARRNAFISARARGAARNQTLANVRSALPPTDLPPARELDDVDLAVLRGLLDRALQPADQWAGFDWVQQYSMAAMRYQLCWAQWSLALAQYASTPAFGGYLSEAQRNLIEKMTDRRVWAYWVRENAWGNLDLNPDPVRRDNIMFSGYFGAMLATYASTTGDRRYEQPGALPFRWSERRVFPYDQRTLMDAVIANHSDAWGLFPCEPGLNFAVCNTISMLGVVAWDRVAGTDAAPALLERFRRSLDEEYTTADGDIITIISRRYGYSLRFARSVVAQAGTAFFLAPLTPDVAARMWAVLRDEALLIDGDGRFEYRPYGGGRIDETDLGNGQRSPVTVLGFASALAREMGDGALVDALLAKADDKLAPVVTNGARWYAGASTCGNVMLALGRFGRAGGWHDVVAKGAPDAWRSGPRLAAAPYPEVLVALAETDGRALDLVLTPGDGGGRSTIVIDQLAPTTTYAVYGTNAPYLIADAEGRARIEVDLGARARLRVAPKV